MYKQKIGISVGNHYRVSTPDVVRLVKQIGFDAISPEWEENINLEKIIATAKECKLEIQSLHAPYLTSADMWSNDKEVRTKAEKIILDSLKDCAKFSIPILVLHTWIGFDYTFNAQDLCFYAFDDLVKKAKELNVKIAFENTEGEEFLFELMTHFKNESYVGFCWDSGHEMCYNHSRDLLKMFGDRLIITHLNDNLGISRFDGKTYCTDDLHLLPYDGIADWDYNISRLKNAKTLEFLNFELVINSKPNRHENDIYEKMSLEEYFTEAYKRACKIAYRYCGL